jgi:hypothetical protein
MRELAHSNLHKTKTDDLKSSALQNWRSEADLKVANLFASSRGYLLAKAQPSNNSIYPRNPASQGEQCDGSLRYCEAITLKKTA